MKLTSWIGGFRYELHSTQSRPVSERKVRALSARRLTFELLEARALLAVDLGDAPDVSAGTGPGNYTTLLSDNGPSHEIVAGLRLGANIDADSGALENASANADDVDGALPDDEDAVTNPATDLILTVGTQPTVNVRATNTTAATATLYGWIDYDSDGVFDNATERASAVVPTGTENAVFTLTFPTIPVSTMAGATYARFRLSTDTAAADPTGAATDGEVEDYTASIVSPGSGTAYAPKTTKIAHQLNGGPSLLDYDRFGHAIASLGDLDGDGVPDLAVGAEYDSGGGIHGGAVHVQFLNADGTVKASTKIASNTNGGPNLSGGDRFGSAIASLGDLDGDGITELAVAAGAESGADFSFFGAVYVLFLNSNGSVKSSIKIASNVSGGPTIDQLSHFGVSVTALGDLDGDGVPDMAVGAVDSIYRRGVVFVLFLNSNGSIKSSRVITHNTNGGPSLGNGDLFGWSLTSLGDLDGDGVTDVAAGARSADLGRGAVYMLFLNNDGGAKSWLKISNNTNGGPALAFENFGAAVASLGDVDGDGITDLAVGAEQDQTSGFPRGAVHILFLNSNGSVKRSLKIASNYDGGPSLESADRFGSSVASLGDVDGDGFADLAVGAHQDNTGGPSRGAVYVLFLTEVNDLPVFTSPTSIDVPENKTKVMTVTTFDPDLPPQTITYSIASGDDQARFSITSGGVLSFVAAPDYEAPADANGDNVYEVIVQADDGHSGTTTVTQTIEITVTAVNDNAPVFTSFPNINVPENTTPLITIQASDADLPAQSVTFSIVGGPDSANFALTSSGVLSFLEPPDFEVPTDTDGDNVYVIIVEASDNHGGTTTQTIQVTVRSGTDFGDAPDPSVGVARQNYQTRLADDGPRHTIVPGLLLGARIDGDNGQSQDSAASVDDFDWPLVNDEDGLLNSPEDLALVIGGQPTFSVSVTNTLDRSATLYGWIDYNADGAFDNSTERASVEVPSGSNGAVTTLVFPVVPSSYVGRTFARFRLSTDAAAADPTGAASDGEVEDYLVTIFRPTTGVADPAKTNKIASGLSGLSSSTLEDGDRFGTSLASLGDFDGDGIDDLAVGSGGNFAVGSGRGTVHLVYLNADGSVKSSTKIADKTNGGPILLDLDAFGTSVTSIGDLDGDGVTDLAVGAPGDDSGGTDHGAVYVLFLNADGSVKHTTKIAHNTNGGPSLLILDAFGTSVTSIGDLDGNGVTDLAVGAARDYSEGSQRGALYVLFLNADGSVKNSLKIANNTNGGPTLGRVAAFGTGVASLGDLDGDGVKDLAVGAPGDNQGGQYGAVHVLFLNADGSVKHSTKIASNSNGGPITSIRDNFGSSVASLGDLDGDGVTDLAVGASGVADRGALYVLFLNTDGSVKYSLKVANNTNGGPSLLYSDLFGSSVVSLGDLDGDGIEDLAVGASGDDTGGFLRGAVHVLFLKPRLAGDYNLDDTVNAADYVLWRKTLNTNVPPYSGADGSGNGVIDAADRQLWMANFGNTATSAGSAAVENLDAAPTAAVAPAASQDPQIDIKTLAEPQTERRITESVSTSAEPSSLPIVVFHQVSSVPREKSLRPRIRQISSDVVSHDRALLAWLASRSITAPDRSAGMDWAHSRDASDPHDSCGQLCEAIELALASIAE